MVSNSAKSMIGLRFQKYWQDQHLWDFFRISEILPFSNQVDQFPLPEKLFDLDQISQKIESIDKFLVGEYEAIPKGERSGKGMVYLCDAASEIIITQEILSELEGILEYPLIKIPILKKDKELFQILMLYPKIIMQFGQKRENTNLQYFALALVDKLLKIQPLQLLALDKLLQKWATADEWGVRESVAMVFRKPLKSHPNETLQIFKEWADATDENLRRCVIESCRPMSTVQWLRDPARNDGILDLLTKLRSDPSVYVRKSVGNNLKDLSKYMPQKILGLLMKWKADLDLPSQDDLASLGKFDLDDAQFYGLWTMKHAGRWMRERNPEFHKMLEKIFGINYVLYFDEKKNKRAIPP